MDRTDPLINGIEWKKQKENLKFGTKASSKLSDCLLSF